MSGSSFKAVSLEYSAEVRGNADIEKSAAQILTTIKRTYQDCDQSSSLAMHGRACRPRSVCEAARIVSGHRNPRTYPSSDHLWLASQASAAGGLSIMRVKRAEIIRQRGGVAFRALP
jgi:hypothetical protein